MLLQNFWSILASCAENSTAITALTSNYTAPDLSSIVVQLSQMLLKLSLSFPGEGGAHHQSICFSAGAAPYIIQPCQAVDGGNLRTAASRGNVVPDL